MGAISINYNRKPTPLEAFKMDMPLEILDHNIEKVEGDIIGDNQLQSYVVYSSCKIKDEVVAIIGQIDYDLRNKEVYIKIMDETVCPHYYNMSKSVFNKLTPLKTQSYAQKWREKVKNNFMKVKKPLFKTEKLEEGITMITLDSFNLN